MISITPRPDNTRRTQYQWIEFWNEKKIPMLSSADAVNLDDDSVQEIRKDFGGLNWSVTSTRIDYAKKTVTHHFGSKTRKPIVIKLKSIPICWNTPISEVLETTDGLAYVKALMNDKKISKQDIIKKFERLSGKQSDRIKFYTPELESRKARPLRAVWLCFYILGFSVGGVDWCDDGVGFSRGVRSISSATKEQTKVSQKDAFKQGYNRALEDIKKKLDSMTKL